MMIVENISCSTSEVDNSTLSSDGLSKVTQKAWEAIVTKLNDVTAEVTNVTFSEGILSGVFFAG